MDGPRTRGGRGLLAAAVVVALGGVALAVVGAAVLARPVGEFLRDPAGDQGAHVGVLSTAGVMLWSAAAAVAIQAAQHGGRGERDRAMLLWLGGLVAALAIDDAFLVHELVVPRVTGVDASEYVVLLGYVGVGVLLVVRFGDRLLARHRLWLGASVGLLAMSAVVDVAGDSGQLLHGLRPVEDLPKWAGIVLSAAWVVRVASDHSVPPPRTDTADDSADDGAASVSARRS